MDLTRLIFLAIGWLIGSTSSTHLRRPYSGVAWESPILPEVRHVTEVKSRHVRFHGAVPRRLNTECGMECQRLKSTKPTTKEELEKELGFETLDMDEMIITNTNIQVGDVPLDMITNNTAPAPGQKEQEDSVLSRKKRRIFGLDTRFSLSSRKFMTMKPFSTAVKISTGCSGILLSPKHVLTSAHCIHDGKRYVKGVRKLKVGKQMATAQKQRSGKGKKKGNKKRRKNRKNKKSTGLPETSREKRDLSMYGQPIDPYFKWIRAKKTHLPQGWLRAETSKRGRELPIEYDYAVIELKRSLGEDYLDVGICPSYTDIPSGHRIHFTGFDSDRDNEMLYRFCPVEEESADLMYHYCDAQEGTSGSGIYIRLFDRKTEQWTRRVIGVFSGHQWVNFGDGSHKEFNTGVRITPLKYAQICYWTKGSYEECRGG